MWSYLSMFKIAPHHSSSSLTFEDKGVIVIQMMCLLKQIFLIRFSMHHLVFPSCVVFFFKVWRFFSCRLMGCLVIWAIVSESLGSSLQALKFYQRFPTTQCCNLRLLLTWVPHIPFGLDVTWMMPMFVTRHHFSAYIPSKKLQWEMTSLMPNASVLAVDFVCVVLGRAQVVHPYLATVRRAVQFTYDYHPKRSWDDFSNQDCKCWSTGYS